MFSAEDLKRLDLKYFAIIVADSYDVTIMSRNIGHYRYLYNSEDPGKGNVVLFIDTMEELSRIIISGVKAV